MHYFQLNSAPDSSNKQDRKSIILISSLAAYIELPWLGDYQASKYGVRGLFKALRNNVGAMGVRMNLIAPWFVQTAMTKDIGPKLEERGLVLAKKETVVEAVMRCATDEGISGKSSVARHMACVELSLFGGQDEQLRSQLRVTSICVMMLRVWMLESRLTVMWAARSRAICR